MDFVIVGAGRVGLQTARAIREGGHDAVLVEHDETAARQARERGFDVVEGDGTRAEPLRRAGIESAHALGGLTRDLDANYAACTIAESFDCRTVMRIDGDHNEESYRSYLQDVDEVIYPERLGAILAKNALLGGNVRAVADIEANLRLAEFTITDAAPMNGYSLSELELPAQTRLLAVGPADGPLRLPDADDTLETGTRLVILSDSAKIDDVRSIIVGDSDPRALGGV